MKLLNFRIKNFKSIIDSNICYLQKHDNVITLAGQNESGKSSILQALKSFYTGNIDEDSIRYNPESETNEPIYAIIELTFIVENNDFDFLIDRHKIEHFPIKNGDQITFTRTFSNNNSSILLDDSTKEKIEKFYSLKIQKEINEEEKQKYIFLSSSEQYIKEIFQEIPVFILLEDICDLLPDKIMMSDLINKNTSAKGYQAVENIQTILDYDFTKIEGINDSRADTVIGKINKKINIDFKEFWEQKVTDKDNIEIEATYKQGKNNQGAYINFYINSNDIENKLKPGQRSQGLKWFLSLYLKLKAESIKCNNLILMLDEPGLYLHIKAQDDVKKLINELSKKNQIIYSTHSPYLIESDKLNRIRLVINTNKYGTTIEKITSKKIANQKEALKPIIDAMGMKITNIFNPINTNNLIVEGISDYYYLTAINKLLNNKYKFSFIPSMGASSCHLLMELCIGWGVKWAILFDEEDCSKEAFDNIYKKFYNYNKDEANNKIEILEGKHGIEEMFTAEDLNLIDDKLNFSDETIIQSVDKQGGKELIARLFLEKVDKGKISRLNISKKTIDGFIKTLDNITKKIKN